MKKIAIPKFSTLDLAFIKDYLRVDYDDDDLELSIMIDGARNFVRKETHRTDEWLDSNTMATIVLLKLIAEFYEDKMTSDDGSTKESEVYKNLLSNLVDYSKNV